MNAHPEEEIQAVMDECGPHLKQLYESGHLILDAGLELESKGLRRTNGKVKVTDGPFTESKEMIGSVFILEAQNMEEALRLASLHPATQLDAEEEWGWRIEIRPIHHFEIRH
ncbi:YciI family protein [Paenibacillus sp. CC-CFT747]|nr:YciI family protein [Paenibacillus sp. CC-CFT747]